MFLVKDGTAHMVEVEIGPEDSGFVAVTKGVAVGDQVILVSQHEIADGAKIASGKDDAKEGKEAAQDKKEK